MAPEPAAIRRILCPIDFSDASARALKHAAALAQPRGATVTVLHVRPLIPSVSAFPPYINPVTLEEVPDSKILSEVDRLCEPLRASGASLRPAVEAGDVAATLLGPDYDTDLIVIGTHGRGGFERWALGSVAEKVIRRSRRPVLTVTSGTPEPSLPIDGTYRRIVSAVDFSEPSLDAAEAAIGLAGPDSHLWLLHIVEWFPESEPAHLVHFNVAEYRRFLEADALERLHTLRRDAFGAVRCVEPRVLMGKAHRQVLAFAEENDVDLIVMGGHGRGAIDRVLFGSTSNAVVRGSLCPVLTFRRD